MLDDSGTYGAECRRKVASGRIVVDAIRSLANASNMQFEFGRFLLPVLMYRSEVYGE